MRFLLLIMIIGCIWQSTPSHAQAEPHAVIIEPLVFVDPPVPASEVSFNAWIWSRPSEVLTESSSGNAVWDGDLGVGVLVDCSQFPTAWQPGEMLVVEIVGGGPPIESFVVWCILNQDNPQ